MNSCMCGRRYSFASAYQKVDHYVIPNWQKSILKEIITSFGWEGVVCRGNLRLLDVGCGLGCCAIELGKLGVETVGIDIEREGVCRASKFAKLQGASNTSFVLACAEHLPFREHIFTNVIAISTMQYIPDDMRAFEELSNVMTTNGLLLARLPNAYSNMFFPLRLIFKLLSIDREHGYLRHYDPESLIADLMPLGFTVASIQYHANLPKLAIIAIQRVFNSFELIPSRLYSLLEGADIFLQHCKGGMVFSVVFRK